MCRGSGPRNGKKTKKKKKESSTTNFFFNYPVVLFTKINLLKKLTNKLDWIDFAWILKQSNFSVKIKLGRLAMGHW